MIRNATVNLVRRMVHGASVACVNRQPCRFIEHLSYDRGFDIEKRDKEDQLEKSPEIIDESNRHMRNAAEGVFKKDGVNIHSYSQYGFRLNDIKTFGPIILFPRAVFAWQISSLDDINEDSLSIFRLVQPKMDTVIIGIGDQPTTKALAKNILEMTRKYRINVEILSTEMACTTFNFLNQQGRMVGAALVPPLNIKFSDDDFISTADRDGMLFRAETMEILR